MSVGADIAQLTDLGGTLKAQIDIIEGLRGTVTSSLGSTVWTGKTRDDFEVQWNEQFSSALTQLNNAFEAAGTNCQNLATNLDQLMNQTV